MTLYKLWLKAVCILCEAASFVVCSSWWIFLKRSAKWKLLVMNACSIHWRCSLRTGDCKQVFRNWFYIGLLSVGAYEETHTRKRATHNSYDYHLIHTSAKWLKWKKGTIGIKLSKGRPRWEGCDSTDTDRIVVHAMKLFHFLHSQKLSSWHHF